MFYPQRRPPQSRHHRILQRIDEFFFLGIAIAPIGVFMHKARSESVGTLPELHFAFVWLALGLALSLCLLIGRSCDLRRQVREIGEKVDALTAKPEAWELVGSLDEAISLLDDPNSVQIDAAKQTLRELKAYLLDSSC